MVFVISEEDMSRAPVSEFDKGICFSTFIEDEIEESFMTYNFIKNGIKYFFIL